MSLKSTIILTNDLNEEWYHHCGYPETFNLEFNKKHARISDQDEDYFNVEIDCDKSNLSNILSLLTNYLWYREKTNTIKCSCNWLIIRNYNFCPNCGLKLLKT